MIEPAGKRDTRIVIADAGPLIHLDELECLPLLAAYPEVLVPDAVWREVEQHRPTALIQPDVPLTRRHPVTVERVEALALVYTLHSGEREALSLCLEYSGALLLTDDTAARLAAKTLAVDAHGTLGVLIRAMRTGQRSRSEVIQLLHDLPQRSTLHIRPGLLQEIIRTVEQFQPERT